jgi:hypothetical protein
MKQMRGSLKYQGGWIQLAALAAGAAGASLFGASKAAKAAKSAAATQAASADKAIQAQKEAAAQTRADLQPFTGAGVSQIPALTNMVTQQQNLVDPNAQFNFVKDNPFYKLLADDAQKRIFSNAAARGKIGSGGTAEALQNSLLLLGTDLINNQFGLQNQAIGNTSNIVQLGQSAAAGQGSATLNAGNNISNLTTDKGNVQAAGKVGAANAFTQGIDSAINAATGIYALANPKPKLEPIDTSMIPASRPGASFNSYPMK